MQLKPFRALVLLITIWLSFSELYSQEKYSSENELKKAASQFFDQEDFVQALPLYSQLLSLYPKEPEYNYKYGTSLLMAGADREKALKYLGFAVSKGSVDTEAAFYLGKAYHLNYDFRNAEKFYKRFKDRANSSLQEKYDVDRQLEMCENGRNLLRKINGTQVLNKQEISKDDFYRVYNLEGVEGKIISKPEAFMSKYDKKNNEKSIIYFPDNSTEVYFSSYGKDGKMGRDIYKVIKVGDGSWSDPIAIDELNTQYDENYIFAHPNGKTLYFASKGHNSMGGYDIFKSTYNPSLANWGKPENMDFAYSTVDNDIMFITDSAQKIAYFASDRNNPAGRITVYKVGTKKVPANLSLVKGKLITENNTSPKAKISVIDFNNQTIGVFETDENGNYEIAINENGGTYSFNVETDVSEDPIHSGKVVIPPTDELKVFRQELELKGAGDNQQLVIRNLFEDPQDFAESNINLSPDLLMGQANLEVNSSADKLVFNDMESTTPNDGVADNYEQPTNSTHDKNSVSTTQNKDEETISSEFPSSNEVEPTNSSVSDNETLDSQNDTDLSDDLSDPSREDDAMKAVKNKETETTNNVLEDESITSTYSSNKELAEEVSQIKASAQQEYEKSQNEVNFAYYLAKVKSTQAQTALQDAQLEEVQVEMLPENQQERIKNEIKELRQKAGALAAQAGFSMQLARILESETNEKLGILEEVSALGEKVKDDKNNIAESGKELNNIKTTIEVRKEEKHSIEIQKDILREKIEQSNIQLSRLKTKKEELEKEKRKLESEIGSLESDKASASKRKLEEIDELLENLSLDAEDVSFQLSQANSQLNTLQNKHNELTAELDFLKEFETIQSGLSTDYGAISNEEKKELIDQVKKYRQDQLSVYTSNPKIALAENIPTEEEYKILQKTIVVNKETENLVYTPPSTKTDNSINSSSSDRQENSASTTSSADDFSNLKYDNSFSYSLPLAQQNRKRAEEMKLEARKLDEQYQQALDNVQNLTSFEARTTAFEEANQLQEHSRAAQIEAAKAYAKANEMEFLQNKARLNSININSEYASSDEQIALLLADEADLYFSYADKIRDKIVETERFSKKETDYQKAYGYEMMALKKQSEALEILGKRVETPQQEIVANRNVIQENTSITVLAPELNTVSAIEVEEIEIDDNEREQITAAEDFKQYSKIFSEREKLIKDAQVEYNKAIEIKNEQNELVEKEKALREEAQSNPDQAEKERLFAEAEVINQRAATLNASIDSINHRVKIKNYLIRQKDNELNMQLGNIEAERANKIIQMAKVVYLENQEDENLALDTNSVNSVSENTVEVNNEDNSSPSNNENDEENILSVNEEVENNEPEDNNELVQIEDEPTNIEELAIDEDTQNEAEVQETIIENNDLDDVNNEQFTESTSETVTQNQEITEPLLKEENTIDVANNNSEINFIPEVIERDIFMVRSSNSSVYNNSNPIPIEPKMPSGIVYQIQVGAFRNPIPQDLFKGFAPLMGEKGPNGITRYTAGFFNKFRSADSSKFEIRDLGYPDAFVVAFLNGERISVSEARKIEGPGSRSYTDNTAVNTSNSSTSTERDRFGNEYINEKQGNETSLTERTVPSNTENLPSAFSDPDVVPVVNSKEVEGLYYSVQIGVFSNPVKKGSMESFENLLVDELNSGLLRYHVGIYGDMASASQRKNQLIDNFSDAFVVVYYNGERITFSEAERIKNQ